jgi:hypothetical protein
MLAATAHFTGPLVITGMILIVIAIQGQMASVLFLYW